MLRHIFTTTLVMTLTLAAPSAVHAFIPLSGSGTWGSYEGSFAYSYTDSENATIVVSLENTSDPENGGAITAFAFNNPNNQITDVSLSSTSAHFDELLGVPELDNTISASPYAHFDIGASTSGSFQGGGNPNKGIKIGESEVFTFTLLGSNLDLLTEAIFMETLSQGSGDGGGNFSFLVRFRGFDNDESDKVPGQFCREGDCTHSVPEPATVALFGIGAAGAFIRRKFIG